MYFAVAVSAGEADTVKIPLVVEATTNVAEVAELITEFMKKNPDISVHYSKIVSGDLFDRVVKSAREQSPADVVWSSAMDLQIKLANDGYAIEYQPAELAQLSAWAQWKDRAYGVTAEPVVIIFNKRLLQGAMVPQDHADLLRLLTEHPAAFQGKIATYDPELSGTGLLFITQDVRITQQTFKLVEAMGRVGVKLYTSSAPMIDRVAAGDFILAYNVPGSYALERAKHDDQLGVIFPSDYTLMMSRIVLIPRLAQHVPQAERFVDFLLSRDGQALLALHSLGSVREDMKPAIPGYANAERALRPIALSIDLLTYLDQAKRHRFLKDWKDALQK
ncbi:ABC transporter substrate-binding protein [Bradyrhizobium sp.]|uniref:ABC transporter substrate-binding protein n=1 Tax=Bradyrhizobium sp. TaxID=376 RepID=UPI002D6919E7|nr:ABC transporter substrate-binding protein [Bradyrhizobium sp.]HZR73242.1 ABC transporter substrate-binding protein [Bradyrhizobium sp.]